MATRTNGWWMFYKDACRTQLVPIGLTSKGENQKALWKTCLAKWQDSSEEGNSLRQHWRFIALQENRRSQLNVVEVPSQSDQQITQHTPDLPLMMANLQVSDGTGTFGLGDSTYALSLNMLTEVDHATTGFVKSYAARWKSRTSQQIEATKTCGQTTQLSCFQFYGFCKQEVRNQDQFDLVCASLRRIVSDHRKEHLVGKKNKGPNVQISHPLLIFGTR